MKTRRHAKILELIQENAIDTQEELLRLLRLEGFNVTQATVSRDIKELRLLKTLEKNGKYKYTMGNKNDADVSRNFLYAVFCYRLTSGFCREYDCFENSQRYGAGRMRGFGPYGLGRCCRDNRRG